MVIEVEFEDFDFVSFIIVRVQVKVRFIIEYINMYVYVCWLFKFNVLLFEILFVGKINLFINLWIY